MAIPRLYGEEFEDLEDPLAVDDVVSRMVAGLRSVGHSLKIYAGEAYWVIFDNRRVISTFRDLADRGVQVQMVVGPALSAGGTDGSPLLINLAQEGAVELFYRPTRGHHSHFRILDDKVAIVQPPHRPLQPLHLREEPQYVDRSQHPDEFQGLVEEFERHTKAGPPVKSVEKFVILSDGELRQIASSCTGDYNDLDKSQIETLLLEVRQRSERKRTRVAAATEDWERSLLTP